MIKVVLTFQIEMTLSKNSKMLSIINSRIKIILKDGRIFIGQMIAFDRHMNFVLSDCEEFRKIKSKKGNLQEIEEKRNLGLVILRGETVISLSIEAPPPVGTSRNRTSATAFGLPGVGMGRAAGRGIPMTGPMKGMATPSVQLAQGRGIPPPPPGRF
jgi:small nuclear ribonucleoprotein B and B'